MQDITFAWVGYESMGFGFGILFFGEYVVLCGGRISKIVGGSWDILVLGARLVMDLRFMIGEAVLQADFWYIKLGVTYCVQVVAVSLSGLVNINISLVRWLVRLTCRACHHGHRED